MEAMETHDAVLRNGIMNKYAYLADDDVFKRVSTDLRQMLRESENIREMIVLNELYWLMSQMLYEIDLLRQCSLLPLQRQLSHLQIIQQNMQPTENSTQPFVTRLRHCHSKSQRWRRRSQTSSPSSMPTCSHTTASIVSSSTYTHHTTCTLFDATTI